jgi:hypothetical protein
MKLNPVSANVSEIETADGKTVLFSYKTPVACHVPGEGFFRTAQSWSRTTSKHINQFISRHGGSGKVREEPQAWFDALV